MKILYFDCFAGAAGDMLVAAMLDAGLDADFLKAQIATLGIKDIEIKIAKTNRAGLTATTFLPIAAEKQQCRNLDQIVEIINRSRIDNKAKKTAITIFEKLAQAEAAVHGKAVKDINFHEVGAIDSIVDIVSAAVGLQALGVERIYCSALSVGSGTVKTAHGLLPIPAPATAELVKGVPIAAGPGEFELLTPTAAAILTTVVDQFCPLPAMKIEAVGYGAGRMEPDEFPNVVRLIMGQSEVSDAAETDSVCLLETNVDDVSGEIIGVVTQKLLEAGVLDVFTTPIYMKHNRPAVKISVLCDIKDIQRTEQMLFEEGVTFGLRRQIVQRSKLSRKIVEVQTEFGPVRIKVGLLKDRRVTAKPELSDCVIAAKKHNTTVKTVTEAAIAAMILLDDLKEH